MENSIKSSLAPVVIYSEHQLVSVRHFRIAPHLYVLHGAPISPIEPISVLGAHGSGVVRGSFVADHLDVVPLLKNITSWNDLGEAIRGSLTLYFWHAKDKEVVVLADPFGSGLTYTYEEPGLFAASSDLRALRYTLKSIGVSLTKSVEYAAGLVLMGSGGYFPSSYEEIDVLDQCEYLTFSPRGVERRVYNLQGRLFCSEESSIPSSADIKSEILSNVRAAAASKHSHKICHLTGGYDSRLVLAAILDLDIAERFRIYSMKNVSEDRRFAEALSAHFGLTMTEHPGAEWDILPGSVEEQFLGPMLNSEGMLPTGPDVGMRSSGSLILSGGYGEILRTFSDKSGGKALKANPQSLAEFMWGGRGYRPTSEDSIFHKDFFHTVAAKAQRRADRGLSLGVAPDHIAEYLFIAERNRYFVGFQSRLWSEIGSQFDPLYSVDAVRTAFSMNFEVRRSNILGFDTLSLLSAPLMQLPFAKTKSFSGDYLVKRGLSEKALFTDGKHPAFDSKVVPKAARRNRGSALQATDEQRARADKLRLPGTRIASFDFIKPLLPSMVEDVAARLPMFKSVFNVDRVRKNIAGSESVETVASCLTLYSIFVWLTHQDDQRP